jgi:hypothetical protein
MSSTQLSITSSNWLTSGGAAGGGAAGVQCVETVLKKPSDDVGACTITVDLQQPLVGVAAHLQLPPQTTETSSVLVTCLFKH